MNVLVDEYMASDYKNINGKENLDLRYVDNVLGKQYEIKNLNNEDIQNLFKNRPSKQQDINVKLLKLGKESKASSKSKSKRKNKSKNKSNNKSKSKNKSNNKSKNKSKSKNRKSSQKSKGKTRKSKKKSRNRNSSNRSSISNRVI